MEVKLPPNVMCMQFVENNPHIAKLCHHLLFNACLVPDLMSNGSIIAFMRLTLFLYHKRYPSLPVREIYRVLNRHRQVLLDTQEREEMPRLINSGYRICHMTHGQEVIREERKKVVNYYTGYFFRARNGTSRR